ncbi:YfcE family phosphodiesterase [Geoglobus acetivorans]|uniref:Phosphoesterase n=1 Tax=Geoglobus acetivorans TaxID=565033 RepID=A0A0A7GH40_GEOAI|nr:putative phosphoesterase [Geoglobus acetivorans]
MRIVAVSDTHAENFRDLPDSLIGLFDAADMVVHAGDYTTMDVVDVMSSEYDFIGVHGNSDDPEVKRKLNQFEVFEVDGVRVFLTHAGHFDYEFHDLAYRAMELGAGLVIFGHIHRFHSEQFDSVRVICPGSPTRPRLSLPSCAVIDIDEGKVEIRRELIG